MTTRAPAVLLNKDSNNKANLQGTVVIHLIEIVTRRDVTLAQFPAIIMMMMMVMMTRMKIIMLIMLTMLTWQLW